MVPLVLSHYQYGECGGLNASANCASKHLMRASTNAIAVAVLLIYTTKFGLSSCSYASFLQYLLPWSALTRDAKNRSIDLH
jgi:hypothetical protein